MAKKTGNSNPKSYVLDESVILFSPYAIFAFDDNDVFVPLSVVNQLRRIAEEDRGEIRANAKEFGILLDSLLGGDAIRSGVKLNDGVKLSNGGSLRIIGEPDQTPINCAGDTKYFHGLERATLVTRDPFTRVAANLQGVRAEDYKSEQSPAGNQVYEGRCCLFVSADELRAFAKERALELAKRKKYSAVKMDMVSLLSDDYKLTQNEYVVLVNSSNPKQTMLGRYDGRKIVPLLYYNDSFGPVYGVRPRNVGQTFALDALLAPPSVAPLVILKGPAGTAKTFLSMAAALAQTIDDWGGDDGTHYRKILLTRPNTKMDDDIGYLKGTETDKVLPALRGLIDNVDNLSSKSDLPEQRSKDGVAMDSVLDTLLNHGTIDAQAMAYMRGRSIKNQYIVCDEMQNATIMQVLSLVTRAGEDSKIVLLGDPDQIDHPLLDKRTNGISYAADRMRGDPTCWQLTFDESECERSPLAAAAIARMKPKGAT